jgi:ATP-dependent RNA helicase DeaD
MQMPTVEDVNNQRIAKFKARITETIENGELELFREVIEQFEQEKNIPAIEIAAALAKMAQGKSPLLLHVGPRERFGDRSAPRASKPREASPRFEAKFEPRFEGRFEGRGDRDQERSAPIRAPREPVMSAPEGERPRPEKREFKKKEFSADAPHPAATRARRPAEPSEGFGASDERPRREAGHEFTEAKRPARGEAEVGMQTYRVAVGSEHQVKPGNIVGAIANEAGIDSKFIGRIEIFDTYSLVDLPEGMPKEVLQHLKKVWVGGQELRIALQRPGGAEPRTESSSYPAKSARPERSSIKRFDRPDDRPRPTLGVAADRGPPRDRSDRPARGGAPGGAPGRSSKKIFSKGPPRGRK